MGFQMNLPVVELTTLTTRYTKAMAQLEVIEDPDSPTGFVASLVVTDRRGKTLERLDQAWADGTGPWQFNVEGGEWTMKVLQTCGCGGTRVEPL